MICNFDKLGFVIFFMTIIVFPKIKGVDMKRIFTFAAIIGLLAFVVSAYADSPRKALFQHFTSASCGPCAQLAPDYYSYVKANLDKVIPISFHGNFQRDIMEDHYGEAAKAYASYYKIQGVPTLVISGKRYKGSPIPNNFASVVNTIAGESSPITINLQNERTGITNNVRISVNSSRKYLSDLYLRVAVVEAYHYYDNAGTNGEKHFYFINRNMLPNPTGTVFKINANETKSFNFSFDLHPEWHPNMIYIVAWVQNDSDKEVIQAANTQIPNLTNIENKPTFTLQLSSNEPAGRIGEMKAMTRTITVKNPNSFPVKAAYVITNDLSYVPSDWTVSLDKSEEVLPAGATSEIKVSINSGLESAMGIFTIGAIPVEDIDLPKSAIYSLYLLSDSVKYAIFNSPMSMYGPMFFNMALKSTNYGDKTAIIPFTPQITSIFKPQDFEIGVFSTTTPYGSLAFLYPDMINAIEAMLNNGKNVLVFSDATGLASKQTQMLPPTYISAINNFFANTLKIEHSNTLPWVKNNNIYSFRVAGLATDTVGKDFTGVFNQPDTNQPDLFTPYTDYFTIPQGSPAQMVAYYYDSNNPNDISKVAAVRLQNQNGSKIVYCGFPLEVTNSIASRQKFLTNAFRWFVGEQKVPSPEIVTDLTNMDFETVKIGQHKDMKIEVYNLGDADLKIFKLEITNDPDGVFTILDENQARTVEPDGMTTYTIRFAPKEEKVYTFSDLVIYNNDKTARNYTVGLKGAGVLPQATGPRVKLSATSLDFGIVDTDKFEDREFEIQNTGIANLVITELRIDNNTDNVFEFISNQPPAEIIPTGKFKIVIRFRPKNNITYNAVVKFTANTPENPYYEIPITGIGNIPVSVVEPENELFTLKVGPNPFANSTNIYINISGNKPVDAQIYLVDATGKKVESIVNGVIASGIHNFKFDGSPLPNGTYYLICNINGKITSQQIVIAR